MDGYGLFFVVYVLGALASVTLFFTMLRRSIKWAFAFFIVFILFAFSIDDVYHSVKDLSLRDQQEQVSVGIVESISCKEINVEGSKYHIEEDCSLLGNIYDLGLGSVVTIRYKTFLFQKYYCGIMFLNERQEIIEFNYTHTT